MTRVRRHHPGCVDPGYVDPGHVDPGHVDPGYVDPGYVDPGYATVAAAGMVAVLVVLLGLLLQCGAVVATRHQAEDAADLAALAGAGDGILGPEAGCARAAAVAVANAAELVACRWSGWTIAVEVVRPCSCPLPVSAPSHGRARAGPVGAK